MSGYSIGIVCKSIDPSAGGHERYLNRLIRSLLEQDWSIRVFARDPVVPDSFREKIQFVSVPSVPLGGGLKRFTFNKYAKRTVENYADSLDLVFTTGKVDFGDVHRSGGGIHRQYLQNCCPPWKRFLPKNWIACRLERNLFTAPPPDTIIVNSNMVKDQAMTLYGTTEDRLRVIYNGVDTERFHFEKLSTVREETREKYGYGEKEFVCLFTAGSWKRKGLPQLLQAFDLLEEDSIELLIAGNTKENRVRRISRKHGFEDRVTLAGYVDKIERCYAAADLLVFPSRYDAGANVVIEALASGLPVVTTRTNGTHELIEDTVNGAVIERAEDTGDLADLIRMFAGQSDYGKLRENAFRTGQKYTMEHHLDQIAEVFERQVSRNQTKNVSLD